MKAIHCRAPIPLSSPPLPYQCIQANCPTSCLNTLIETGARVNEADRQGRTPLHVAAERGRTEAAALLQEHGADMEAVEKVRVNHC